MKALRPIRVDGDTAYITLTKGYEAIIDAADVPLVSVGNWCASVRTYTVYAVRKEADPFGGERDVRLHRLIMGNPADLLIDHIDGNGLNNRRSNLRMATKAQNGMNRRTHSNNSCGLKGVSWNARKRKWEAHIWKDRTIHLGRFNSSQEAHAAYVAASLELHGDYGRFV